MGPLTSGGALALDSVSFRYGRRGPLVLDNVSLTVSGGAVTLLGPNGAGKSTLFSILSTAAEPQSGRVWIGGYDSMDGRLEREKFRRRLGVLPQTFSAFGAYSCVQFLRYVAWLRKVPSADVEQNVKYAMSIVELEEHANTLVKRLSGGTRQRLGLAQAMVSRPAVVLLDEPTVGLDPAQRALFLTHLRVVSQDTFVLMTTHLVEDVANFAREVVVLADGQVRYCGGTAEFCQLPPGSPVSGAEVEAAYLRTVSQ